MSSREHLMIISGRHCLFLIVLSCIVNHLQAGDHGIPYPDDLDDDKDVVYNWPVDPNSDHKVVDRSRSDQLGGIDEGNKHDAHKAYLESRHEQSSKLYETKVKIDQSESKPSDHSNSEHQAIEQVNDEHPAKNDDRELLVKSKPSSSINQDNQGSHTSLVRNEPPRAERQVQDDPSRVDDRVGRQPAVVLDDILDTRSYCSTRPGETCCTGRNDACSVPYHDTLCYCDIFCDRTGTDCCPDFMATCGALVNKHFGGVAESPGSPRDTPLGYRYPDDHRDKTGGEDDGKGLNKADGGKGAGGDHGASDLRGNPEVDHHDRQRDLNPDTLKSDSNVNPGYDRDGRGPGRSDWEYDEGVSDKTGDAYIESGSLDGRGDSAGDRARDGSRDNRDQTLDELTNNCHHRGKLYQPNDEFKENCNNCTCVNAVLKSEYNWKCTQKICLIRPELLEHVAESADCGWKAQNYSFFWGLSAEEGVRYKLGTLKPSDSVNRMTMLNVRVDEELPDEFDARTQWPGLVSPVLDQGFCAASWAFSTTGVASDRLRIHSGGVYGDVTLSAQHLISCDTDQSGCAPGHVDRAWWFMRKVGLVSDECYPYESGHRKVDAGSAEVHHGSSPRAQCLLPRTYEALKTSQCPRAGVPQTVYRASPPYKIAPNEREIMKELMTNGPVQAIMEVKEDFYMYRSGVYSFSLPAEYQTDSQRQNRYHSVRIIGWGVDRQGSNKETKYWLIANSWGRDWGEDGYFRILRGADESSIESHVVGVWLKVNDRMLVQRNNNRGGAKDDRRSHNRERGGVNDNKRRNNREDERRPNNRGFNAEDKKHVRHPRHHRKLHQHSRLD